MKELNLPQVDFIKMDVEGSEENAVRGAEATLRKYRPRMAIAAGEHGDVAFAYLSVQRIVNFVDRLNLGYTTGCGECRELGWRYTIPREIFFYRAQTP